MSVRWVSAFVDVPADRLDASAEFWAAVTGSVVGEPVGDRGEFLPLEPPTGHPCLWLQRIQDGPVGVHPDLYVADPDAEASRATGLGATVTDRQDGLVVATSPGGLAFCLVRHRDQVTRPEAVGPAGARSAVDQVCLDIPADRYDLECDFWSALTGWARTGQEKPDEFNRLVRPGGIPYAFLLQRLDDQQPAVTAHLDLACEDRDAVTARHLALGADEVRRTAEWTVLRDPAGVVHCTTDRPPGAV
ncbi:MAG TPA: VOC family protein [Nocardioidaceae bacterium]|nr:VOC family protein [Nocardioidaceae bacterium]